MKRIRTIKPEIFNHEELFDLGERTGFPIFQAFCGMLSIADREGRFKWRPRAIHSEIIPYHTKVDMADVLEAMASIGVIEKYTVDGEDYGVVVNFKKHQVINAREAKSTIPPKPEKTLEFLHVHARDGGNGTHVHAHGEGKGREEEGKGEGREGRESVGENSRDGDALESREEHDEFSGIEIEPFDGAIQPTPIENRRESRLASFIVALYLGSSQAGDDDGCKFTWRSIPYRQTLERLIKEKVAPTYSERNLQDVFDFTQENAHWRRKASEPRKLIEHIAEIAAERKTE